jgi:hypothetical protein
LNPAFLPGDTDGLEFGTSRYGVKSDEVKQESPSGGSDGLALLREQKF